MYNSNLISDTKTYLLEILIFIWRSFITALEILIPRDKNTIVFAGHVRDEFASNMKYLFLETSNKYNKNAVWITQSDEVNKLLRSNGYQSHKRWTLRYLYSLLRAEYIVTSVGLRRLDHLLMINASKVQLWHGNAFKRMPEMEMGVVQKSVGAYDYACLNNAMEEKTVKNSYVLRDVYYTGYPRNDLFFNDIKDSDLGVPQEAKKVVCKIADEKPVIGYFPTWRKNESAFKPFDFERMNEFLIKKDAYLIVKPHMGNELPAETSDLERIYKLPSLGDIYPLFPEIDIMITDYSSICLDFLFTDNQLIFFPYDMDGFTDFRGFVTDYESLTPGPKAYEFSELIELLDRELSQDQYESQRENTRDLMFEHYNGNAIDDIHDLVFKN
jgi:CDP-glycerol glycerophosphotransferase (TagB/SpsB family)